MSEIILPEEDGVWNLRYSGSFSPVTLDNNRRYIPSFSIPGEFTSDFVAVGIEVTASGENWRFGGHIAQQFNFPSSGFRHPGKAFHRTEDLIVNDVTIINIPIVSSKPYKLRYFPPTWFRDLRFTIWEYTGESSNSTTQNALEILQFLAELVLQLGLVPGGSLTTLLTILIGLDIPDILNKLDFIYKFIRALNPSTELSSNTQQGQIFFIS